MAISFIRTVILYLVIMVSMRIMGKRQLGQLEPSELVVAVLISDLAANPLQDVSIPLLYGLIPVVTLVCSEIIVSGAILKNVRLRAFICGKPSILIKNGVIDQREMFSNRYTVDELGEELRAHGVTDISAVQYAILETDGSLSVITYPSESPLTPREAGIAADGGGYPVTVINCGRILSNNLKMCGLNEKWLEKQLRAHGVKTAGDVYLMTVNDAGEIYFAAKERKNET